MSKVSTTKGWRTDTNGNYCSFLIYHPVQKKTVRIGYKQGFPKGIDDISEAERQKKKILKTLNIQLIQAKKRADWLDKYDDFNKLFDDYSAWAKKEIPRGHKTNIAHIKNYVLRWYIGERNLNNIETWPQFFYEFRNWISKTKPLRSNSKDSKRLAVNTQNNIIKALNSFTLWYSETTGLPRLATCKEFHEKTTFKKGLEATWKEEDLTLMEGLLRNSNHALNEKLYVLFRLLHTSGMRLNEALGLHIGTICFDGYPEQEEALFNDISKAGLDIYGYILLKDQPALKRLRDKKTNRIPRIPLKTKKEITPKNNRYIPLFDKDTALNLLKMVKNQSKSEDYIKKKYGTNYEDYLIFEGLHYSTLYTELKKITSNDPDAKHLKKKTIHDLRHTASTNISRLTKGATRIGEKVLGHSSKKINERYTHLAQEIEENHKINAQNQKIESITIKKIVI